MIEQIDDVVSYILNRLGIYGGCDDKCTKDNPCRCHAESDLKDRIMAAVEVERLLDARQQGESPVTDAQQLRAAIALLNRWMDDPDQDLLLGETDRFVRNNATAAV